MKAVVLAGGQEYGQSPLARQAPRALWPFLDKPVVHHVLRALAGAGVREMAVSANGRTHDIAERLGTRPEPQVTVHYSEDPLPRGAAGCIKDCEPFLGDDGRPFLVAPGAALLVDVDLDELVARHRRAGHVLTVAAQGQAGSSSSAFLQPTGLYVCEPEVLAHIKRRGYQDMKEQLIPRLVEAGLRVGAVPITGRVLHVLDEEAYLNALVAVLDDERARAPFTAHLRSPAPGVWIDARAEVDASARVVGPAYVAAGARLAAGSVVIGPTVVGEGCEVGEEAVVHESILWRGSRVGAGAMVEQAVLASCAEVAREAEVRGSVVVADLSTAERRALTGSWDLCPADLARASASSAGPRSSRLFRWAEAGRSDRSPALAAGTAGPTASWWRRLFRGLGLAAGEPG